MLFDLRVCKDRHSRSKSWTLRRFCLELSAFQMYRASPQVPFGSALFSPSRALAREPSAEDKDQRAKPIQDNRKPRPSNQKAQHEVSSAVSAGDSASAHPGRRGFPPPPAPPFRGLCGRRRGTRSSGPRRWRSAWFAELRRRPFSERGGLGLGGGGVGVGAGWGGWGAPVLQRTEDDGCFFHFFGTSPKRRRTREKALSISPSGQGLIPYSSIFCLTFGQKVQNSNSRRFLKRCSGRCRLSVFGSELPLGQLNTWKMVWLKMQFFFPSGSLVVQPQSS